MEATENAMTDRKWQVICNECQWTALVFRQGDAEAYKRAHQQATGHKDVTIRPVTKDDSGWEAATAGSDLLRAA